MMVGFLSLPAELICYTLLLLSPSDICHCAATCKTVWQAAQNINVQHKLELYAQGFTETASLGPVDFFAKICSLKKLSSLWHLSDIWHAKTVFEESVDTTVYGGRLSGIQSVKCGIWWMWAQDNIFIRDCNANVKLSGTWPTRSLSTQHQLLISAIVDPLQDLVITLSSQNPVHVIDAGQDYQVFLVQFRSASSQLPHPDSACASLECKHTFDSPGRYLVWLVNEPAICGDRVVVLYYIHSTQNLFIQVIDWRKGRAKSYPLYPLRENKTNFHLIDEQTIVVVREDGLLSLYTLRELDGSPQHRVTYLLPGLRYYRSLPYYVIHATPSFHSTAARPDHMPGYVPSLESQIMVVEVLSEAWPVILVIDMVVFSEQAMRSLAETPREVPWSDWGHKYTCCFAHHPSHRISVFGSKMAYALPASSTPQPGERVRGFYSGEQEDDKFFVHIWDFNMRGIARAKHAYGRSSPDRLVRKPGRIATSCLAGDVDSNRAYTAAVSHASFARRCFDRLFLEYDRLTLTWSRESSFDIQVVCPVDRADIAV